MASCSSLCLCLLLLVAVVGHAAVATSTNAAAVAEAPGHARAQLPRKHDDLAPAACWKSVLETSQPCARDVLQTLVSGTVHLGKDCCAALGRADEKCIVDVLSSLPVGAAYLPVVKRICGLVSVIIV